VRARRDLDRFTSYLHQRFGVAGPSGANYHVHDTRTAAPQIARWCETNQASAP
jgi:hypothetical protein